MSKSIHMFGDLPYRPLLKPVHPHLAAGVEVRTLLAAYTAPKLS